MNREKPDACDSCYFDTSDLELYDYGIEQPLEKGVPLETVSILLGHKNIQVTQRHYAPWVKSRQIALEEAVKAALK